MPQQQQIDISAGLIPLKSEKKGKAGQIDISAGLQDVTAPTGVPVHKTKEEVIFERQNSQARFQQHVAKLEKARQDAIVGGRSFLTTGLASQEQILGAMTGLTMEQLTEIEQSLAHGQYTPQEAAQIRFLLGSVKSMAGIGSAATSPAGMAATAAAPFAGPVAGAVKLAAGATFAGEGSVDVADAFSKIAANPGMLLNPDVAEQFIGGLGAVSGGAAGIGAGAKPFKQPAMRATQRTLGIGEKLTEQAVSGRAATAASNEQIRQVRAAAEADLNQTAMTLRNNVRTTEQAVRAELGGRYEAVRSVIGEKPPQVDAIIDAAETAQQAMRGSLESKRIFDEIRNELIEENALSQASVFRGAGMAGRLSGANISEVLGSRFASPEVAARLEAQLGSKFGQPSVSSTFPELQRLYTSMGRKMFGRDIPAGTFRALRTIRDAIGNEMQRMADESGVGNSLREAQAQWSQYERAFLDARPLGGRPGSANSAGSPLARVIAAEDPGYAYSPMVGKAGARAAAMLQQYQSYGANPQLAIDLVAKHGKFKSLPSPGKEPVGAIEPQKLKMAELDKLSNNLRKFSRFEQVEIIGATMAFFAGHPWYAATLLAHPVLRHLAAAAIEKNKAALSQPTEREMKMVQEPPPEKEK